MSWAADICKTEFQNMERLGDYEISLRPRDSLGEGSFGQVYRGTDTRTGAPVAAKCVKESARVDAPQIRAEIDILKAVKGHDNVLNFIDVFEDSFEDKSTEMDKALFWIITEICGMGNLYEYSVVTSSQNLPNPRKRCI